MIDGSVVELRRVDSAEQPALNALVDDYLAELAGHRERPVGPVDADDYEYLPYYWSEPGRHPFFLCANSSRKGFALIREVPESGVIQMSDFYVRPDARRSGLGSAALAQIWREFPGEWELQVHAQNEAAMAFWPRCIAQWATGEVRAREVMEDDGRRIQYNFEMAAT